MPWKMVSRDDTPTDQMLKIVGTDSFEVGSETWVGVTHINNPHSFYVRIRILDKHVNVVEQCGAPINPLELYPQINILYKSRIAEKYIRGKVFYIDGSGQEMKCDIFAMDYGFFEKNIPINEIMNSANCRDHEIPPLAKHCQLANCFPSQGEWCEEDTSSLKHFIGNERALVTVREKRSDVLVVEVRNSCPDELSKMMAYAGCSIFGSYCSTASRFCAPQGENRFFKHKILQVGDTLHVRVQSGNDLKGFFVAEKNDYKVYLNERINLSEFSARQNPLNIDEIQINKHVAVFVNASNKYERGIVRKVLSETVRVQLVDWGNTVTVHMLWVKPLLEKFYNHPVTAIYCAMEDQPLPAIISRLLLGTEFSITVVQVGDQFDVPHKVSGNV